MTDEKGPEDTQEPEEELPQEDRPQEDRPEPPRGSLPEPPWFAMRDPEPPRGSPEAPPLAATEYRSPESWSAGLEQIAVAGQQRARTDRRKRRPLLLIGAAVIVVAGVAAGVAVALTSGSDSSGAGQARVPFCDPGTAGSVTTTGTAQEPTTPVGAVTAFVDAAVRDRSAAAVRATMSEAAPTPSASDLQAWITALPPSTDGWCARITTTDSTARLLVDIRIRTADGVAQIARGDTFYVSSPTPDRWTIDAVVAGDFAVDEQVG